MTEVIFLTTKRRWVPLVWCPVCDSDVAEDHDCPHREGALPAFEDEEH